MTDAIDVTAALVVKQGKVLIARRPAGGRHPGMWEFPGGKVEPGEGSRECLEREMMEEMGVRVKAGERAATVLHDYGDFKVSLTAYWCTISSGEPGNLGCDAHAWVDPLVLVDYDLLPPDRELVRELF